MVSFLPEAGTAQQNLFTNYQMGGLSSEEFTSNSFTAVGVGKGDRIWAGTNYNGLYTFDPGFNIWRKSSRLTNVFINHILADPDGGIWIGQSGTLTQSGNSNIAGGVNYFPVNSDISMSFYSVQGTTTGAFLRSRNVRSLFLDPTKGSANNSNPGVWVAQGSFTTSFTATKGGINYGLHPLQPFFTNVTQGLSTQANELTNCEAIGGNAKEVWVAARPNNGKAQILRYNRQTRALIGTIDNSNNSLLSSTFFTRAIFFDNNGYTWIGFSTGGLLVLKPDSTWERINFPELLSGAAINNNALAQDEFGNVYIGTNTGLLRFKSPLYNPGSVPWLSGSYEKYTTDNGLPSNNITGIAYDAKHKRMILATSGGVSFMRIASPFIEGLAADFTMNPTGETLPGYQLNPLPIGATVGLYDQDNGDLLETREVTGQIPFKMEDGQNNKLYKLEIKARGTDNDITYLYFNIPNETLLLPSNFPFAIIKALKDLKPKMETKDIPLELSGIRVNLPLKAGFRTKDLETGWSKYNAPAIISQDHQKILDNLAEYYASLYCVNNFGDTSIELFNEGFAAIFPLIEGLMGTNDMIEGYEDLLETVIPGSSLGIEKKDTKKLLVAQIKLARSTVTWVVKKIYSYTKPDAKTKKILEYMAAMLNDALDILEKAAETYAEEGGDPGYKGKAAKAMIQANLQKAINSVFTILAYNYYAKVVHKDFIANASFRSATVASDKTYAYTYARLLEKGSNSLTAQTAELTKTTKENIELYKKISAIADYTSKVLDAGTNLKFLPSGQAFAAAFKALSLASKFVKLVATATSVSEGIIGGSKVIDISEKILEIPTPGAAQNNAPDANAMAVKNITPLAVPASLTNAAHAYKASLIGLKAVYNGSVANAQYGNRLRTMQAADSTLTSEIQLTYNSIWAAADSAAVYVPGFGNQLGILLDSFNLRFEDIRRPFNYSNLAFIANPADDSLRTAMQAEADSIILVCDSLLNRLGNFMGMLSEASFPAAGNLAQTGKMLIHNQVPGSTGSVSYTFKNFGQSPVTQVKFKLTELTGGYLLTTPDSLLAGNIVPGGTCTFSFSFTSPLHDSLGKYFIEVQATQGVTNDVAGSLFVIEPGKYYTVQSGNWHSAATWHSGTVPDANTKVHLNHPVVVAENATCKTLTTSPGVNIEVKPGKKLEIRQ